MISQTVNDIKQNYVVWNVDNVISLIDQILKSPQLIAGTNQINPTDITKIKSDQRKIATKALEKEADFLINKHKIKTQDDFYNLIDKLPAYKIDDLRRKFIDEIIKESR